MHFDELEGHRAQLFESVGHAVRYAQKMQADEAAGQSSLFGDAMGSGFQAEPNLPMVDPWPTSQKLKNERDLLGFYVSGHPLETYAAEARAFSSASLGDIEGISKSVEQAAAHSGDGAGSYRQQGPIHRFCGIITEIQHRTTRTGKPIVFASIEDFTGQGEIICFANEYDRYQQYLKQDEIVFVKGNTDIRGGGVKIKVVEVLPMWKVREMIKGIVLRVDVQNMEVEAIQQFRELCDENRGNCKLYFDVTGKDIPGGVQRIHSRKYVVEPTPDLMQGISKIFGKDNVLLESDAMG